MLQCIFFFFFKYRHYLFYPEIGVRRTSFNFSNMSCLFHNFRQVPGLGLWAAAHVYSVKHLNHTLWSKSLHTKLQECKDKHCYDVEVFS